MKRTPTTLGYTGLQYANNTLIERELQAALRFPKAVGTFDQMQTDPIISGSLFMIQQFIRKARIYVEPVGGIEATELAKQRAEQIEKALFKNMNRSFDLILTDILMFVKYGFSFVEPTFKVKDGMITWKDFPTRHPSTIKGFKWKEDNSGEIDKLLQYQPAYSDMAITKGKTEIEIPYNRLLHFRTSSESNNPYGRSILKNAWRAWYYKSNLEEKEAIGIEREMNGLPKITMPVEYFNANNEETPELAAIRDEMFKMAANARMNSQAFIAMPSNTDEGGKPLFSFDLISSNGTRSIDTNKVIERYDYRIAQSMLTDFLLMGSSSTGSFALSDNKVSTFLQSLESYLEVIVNEINNKAIPVLFERNDWDVADAPSLKYKPISSISASELGKFLDSTKNFLTADQTLENAIREEVGLPPRDNNSLYIEKPTVVTQAEAQMIGMQASAARSGSSEPEPTPEEDDQAVAEEIMKKLTQDYRGEA